MPCTPFSANGPNGPITGFICGPRRRMAPCDYCRKAHTHLCDYPVPTLSGKRATCDLKLCADHRKPGGAGFDFCPEHWKLLPVPDISPSHQMSLALPEE